MLKCIPASVCCAGHENFQLFIHSVKGELPLFEMLLGAMGAEIFSEAWTKTGPKKLILTWERSYQWRE